MTPDEAIELGEKAKNIKNIEKFIKEGKKLMEGNDPSYYNIFKIGYEGRFRDYEDSIPISKEIFDYVLNLIEEELKETIKEIDKYEINKA